MTNLISENKQIVERFFDNQRTGNLLGALDFLTEDVVWLVPGDWEMAGVRDKDGVREMLAGLNQFKGGLKFKYHSVTAEDDRVVVITRVNGTLVDGREYQNELGFVFVIRGDKICHVTEMTDSAKSRRFWLGKT
jgi:ketosteroid isomerase-like protein